MAKSHHYLRLTNVRDFENFLSRRQEKNVGGDKISQVVQSSNENLNGEDDSTEMDSGSDLVWGCHKYCIEVVTAST